MPSMTLQSVDVRAMGRYDPGSHNECGPLLAICSSSHVEYSYRVRGIGTSHWGLCVHHFLSCLPSACLSLVHTPFSVSGMLLHSSRCYCLVEWLLRWRLPSLSLRCISFHRLLWSAVLVLNSFPPSSLSYARCLRAWLYRSAWCSSFSNCSVAPLWWLSALQPSLFWILCSLRAEMCAASFASPSSCLWSLPCICHSNMGVLFSFCSSSCWECCCRPPSSFLLWTIQMLDFRGKLCDFY